MENKKNQLDLERAWKDEEYRKTLTPQQLVQLPVVATSLIRNGE